MSKKGCIKDCRFCYLLNRNTEYESHKPICDSVLFETDNFVIIPTIGALLEGWLLIVSKEHYLCVGEMPSNVYSELKTLKKLASNILEDCYSKPTIFEHGPSESGSLIGCGIDHVHFHLVPISFELINKNLLDRGYELVNWKKANDDFSILKKYFLNNTPYFYAEEPSNNCWISSAEGAPSQYFRRLIASQLGIYDCFDYKKHEFTENILRTIKTIGPRFSEIKSELTLEEGKGLDHVLESI